MSFEGKRIIVVGGTSGIGFGIASAAASQGAEVLVVGRSQERLDKAVSALSKEGRCRGFVCDAIDENRVRALFSWVGEGFDHLVITAAGDLPNKTFRETEVSDVRKVLEAKVSAAFILLRHGLDKIRIGGSIVMTSGINAFIPLGKNSIVSAANGALIAYARALAIELRPIRVNVVSPGWVDTPIWSAISTEEDKQVLFKDMAGRLPVGRIGTPEDIASAVLMLLENGFITGTVIHVDGGRQLL